MKKLLVLVLLALPLSAQQLPEAPQPQPAHGKVLDRRFVATEGVMYGGILFDLATSMRWVGSCRYESNDLFAKNHGTGFKAGTYLAVNLPIAGFETTVHILTRRYAPRSKAANWLMDILTPGVGAPHYVAAAQWINDCH